ncbi:MAG: CPBP family intramembrane metalloprotease [Oscillochloris sp.]|nr:CPBP family intramembrane metalloprotease [Oscillochloris sp.]
MNAQRNATLAAPRSLLIWIYPLLIVLAELALITSDPQLGLLIYALITSALVIHRALSPANSSQQITLALLPVPLIRILALAIPLQHFPTQYWYGIIALPLLLSSIIIIRQLRLSARELGVRSSSPQIQAMIALSGIGLGAASHIILRPEVAPTGLNTQTLWLPAVMLSIGSLTEELLFRGILQATSIRWIGRGAIFYSALVFSALQISYQSPAYMLLSFSTGLFYAYSVRLSGSILGVILAHSLATITLNVLLPNVPGVLPMPLAQFESWLVAGSGGLALLVFGMMVWQNQHHHRRIKLTIYRGQGSPLISMIEEQPAQPLSLHPDHSLRYLRPIRLLPAAEAQAQSYPLEPLERAVGAPPIREIREPLERAVGAPPIREIREPLERAVGAPPMHEIRYDEWVDLGRRKSAS